MNINEKIKNQLSANQNLAVKFIANVAEMHSAKAFLVGGVVRDIILKKNGLMFVATLNKTLKSYVFAIIGAEYVLRWLPIGTHDWEKFVKPEDLKNILSKNNLKIEKIDGMNFNIFKDEWNISKDTSINYIAKSLKV